MSGNIYKYPKSLKQISRVLKIHYARLDGQLAIWLIFEKEKEWFPLENKANYEMNHSWSIFLSFKTLKSVLAAWKVIFPDEMFRASIELNDTDSFFQTCCVPSMFFELFWLLAVHKSNILLTFFRLCFYFWSVKYSLWPAQEQHSSNFFSLVFYFFVTGIFVLYMHRNNIT